MLAYPPLEEGNRAGVGGVSRAEIPVALAQLGYSLVAADFCDDRRSGHGDIFAVGEVLDHKFGFAPKVISNPLLEELRVRVGRVQVDELWFEAIDNMGECFSFEFVEVDLE